MDRMRSTLPAAKFAAEPKTVRRSSAPALCWIIVSLLAADLAHRPVQVAHMHPAERHRTMIPLQHNRILPCLRNLQRPGASLSLWIGTPLCSTSIDRAFSTFFPDASNRGARNRIRNWPGRENQPPLCHLQIVVAKPLWGARAIAAVLA